MPRGRPRTKKSTLPPCYFRSHGAIYHVKAGVWRRVGDCDADAHRDYANQLARPEHGKLNPLIDAAFNKMKARKVDPLAANTIKGYAAAADKLKFLLRAFTDPRQVLPRHAAMIKTELQGTPNWCNRLLSFGRIVFADLLEQQLLDSNPFMGVRLHKLTRRTRLITPEEWTAIYSKASPRIQCVVDGLYLTGQRINDLLDLDERDLLEQGIYFKQRKTRKELIVEWNPQLREWVARCRSLQGKVMKVDFTVEGKPRPLIRTNRGRRPAYMTVYNEWIATLERAGVEDCNMHDNRALSGTDAQRQGLDPQKLLGHEDAKTTKTYLRGREIDVVQGPQMTKRTA